MKVEITGSGSILSSSLSASALIDDRIQIDVPNGYCKRRREAGKDMSLIDVILLTHFHGDHYFDFPFLLMELGLRKERDRPLTIAGPPGLEAKLKQLHEMAFANWSRVVGNCNIEFIEFAERTLELNLECGKYLVEPVTVDHANIPAYGFIIDNNRSVLGYTGDTVLCDGVEKIVSASSTIIIDTSFEKDTTDHIGLTTAIAIAEEPINVLKTFICTHMTDKVRAHSDLGRLHRPSDLEVFYVESQN